MISTKVCTISLEYDAEYTEQELEALKKFDSELRFKNEQDFVTSKDDEEKKEQIERWKEYFQSKRKRLKQYSPDLVVDIIEFMEECPFSKFKITKVHKVTSVERYSNLATILKRFEDNITAFNEGLKDVEAFNTRANVHIGGSLLLTVNELLLKEDCCTDDIQIDLSAGWRIVAVCVQPDGRRPDYILGRYNPEKEKDFDYAKREG